MFANVYRKARSDIRLKAMTEFVLHKDRWWRFVLIVQDVCRQHVRLMWFDAMTEAPGGDTRWLMRQAEPGTPSSPPTRSHCSIRGGGSAAAG